MVLSKFQNSNFLDFIGIKFESDHCQNLFGYIVLSKNTKLCDKNVTMVQLKLYSNGTRIMNSLVWSHVPLTFQRACTHLPFIVFPLDDKIIHDLSKNTKLCDKNVTMVQLKLYSNGTRIMNSLVWSHVPLTLMRVLCYHFGQKRNNSVFCILLCFIL